MLSAFWGNVRYEMSEGIFWNLNSLAPWTQGRGFGCVAVLAVSSDGSVLVIWIERLYTPGFWSSQFVAFMLSVNRTLLHLSSL